MSIFLILQDQVIRSSDPSINTTPAQAAQLQEQSNQPTSFSLERKAISLNNHEYVSTVLPLDTLLNIELISALNVDNLIAIQQDLVQTLTAALFIIILIAFGLGIWQSQRISLPIANLADTAVKFRQGKLDSPVSIQSSVSEISQLAIGRLMRCDCQITSPQASPLNARQ